MPKRKLDTRNLWKRGNTWYVCYVRGDVRILQSAKTSDLDEAIAKRDEILSVFAHRDKADAVAALQGKIDHHLAVARKMEQDARPKISIPQLWQRWMATAPTAAPATLTQYEVQVDRFRRWMADNHPSVNAEDMPPAIAAAFVRHLEGQKRSANTINKYVMLLRQIWRAVLPDRPTPWDKIEKRRGETVSRRPLTTDELSAVLDRADAELRTLILMGALLALRLGDACTLRWSNVDLQRGVIMLTPRKTRTRNGRLLSLPIVGALRGALESLPKTAGTDYVLPRIAAEYLRHPTYVTDRLQRLFAAAGIETQTERDTGGRKAVSVGFHSLRHFFATQLAVANVPHAVAQAILGHRSAALLATYQHVGAGQIRDAVQAVAHVKRRKTAAKSRK